MNNSRLNQQSVLVTGANGFVGSHVINELLKEGCFLKAAVRSSWANAPEGVELITADLSSLVDWDVALVGVDAVIHLGARVHQMNESPKMALELFRNINTRATLELAEKAAKAGVKRFIYLSTMAVNGNFTHPGEYFTEQSAPNPKSSYAISKYESELGLQKLAQQYPMEVTIIRPPMVYGAYAPGNFSKLVSLIKSRIPLPFSSANNLRSFIFINNLVDFIVFCIDHPAAGNELFLVSDGDDISLNFMIRQISQNLNLSASMFPLPSVLLERLFQVLGRPGLAAQLLRPMRVDISKAQRLLDWTPSSSSLEGIAESMKSKNIK
jgi:nucleoside-diphosphate-sugar epimerase